MAKGNLPNNVSAGVPNVGNLTSEQTEYNRLFNSLTRTQSGEGTFGASPSSGLSYTTNSYPADVDVFNKGEEGLLNMFAKYVLIDYNLTGDEVQTVIDDTATNETNLDILRIAKLDTGAADAYVVTTAGTFSRTDGNILNFIPANNNTGASTINEDTNGVAAIEKYVDGVWVAIEEGDLKKFQQVGIAWNTSRSAFQLAPKGGATLKNPPQRGEAILSSNSLGYVDVTISAVDLTIATVEADYNAVGSASDIGRNVVSARFLNSTTIRLERGSFTNGDIFQAKASWKVTEYNNVKSLQSGTKIMGASSENVTISSVDITKSKILNSFKSPSGSGDGLVSSKLVDSTTITFTQLTTTANTCYWFVIEFN